MLLQTEVLRRIKSSKAGSACCSSTSKAGPVRMHLRPSPINLNPSAKLTLLSVSFSAEIKPSGCRADSASDIDELGATEVGCSAIVAVDVVATSAAADAVAAAVDVVATSAVAVAVADAAAAKAAAKYCMAMLLCCDEALAAVLGG